MNPWGIAFSATSPFWVANNVAGTSTLYSGDVNGPLAKVPMVVTIPGGGAPTGVVFNGTGDFVVHSGTSSGPARFIFASQTGVISGWNSAVPPPSPSTNAQIGATADAVYTGLAIGQSGGANYLYAADFKHNTIDVPDKTFQPVELNDRSAIRTFPTATPPSIFKTSASGSTSHTLSKTTRNQTRRPIADQASSTCSIRAVTCFNG